MTTSRFERAGRRTRRMIGNTCAFACKSLFWVCCSPCLLCVICCIKPRGEYGTGPDRTPKPPRPTTPLPRSRALTLPLIEKSYGQTTRDQSQSAFMSKLPLEIRRIIYCEILGGVDVKLNTRNGKAVTRRMNNLNGLCNISPGFQFGILRTCRQM
jgi:hypothetical protein